MKTKKENINENEEEEEERNQTRSKNYYLPHTAGHTIVLSEDLLPATCW